jgi:hypothetical protein
MSFLIVIWTVWAVLAVALLALLLYRVSVTQYEEDQLFIDGGNLIQQQQQEQIFMKLARIRPAIRIIGGMEGFVTLAIAAFYVMDALHQF